MADNFNTLGFAAGAAQGLGDIAKMLLQAKIQRDRDAQRQAVTSKMFNRQMALREMLGKEGLDLEKGKAKVAAGVAESNIQAQGARTKMAEKASARAEKQLELSTMLADAQLRKMGLDENFRWESLDLERDKMALQEAYHNAAIALRREGMDRESVQNAIRNALAARGMDIKETELAAVAKRHEEEMTLREKLAEAEIGSKQYDQTLRKLEILQRGKGLQLAAGESMVNLLPFLGADEETKRAMSTSLFSNLEDMLTGAGGDERPGLIGLGLRYLAGDNEPTSEVERLLQEAESRKITFPNIPAWGP